MDQTRNIQMKTITGKVGSYAISTVEFDSWTTSPIVQTPHRTRKSRAAKEIIYKIFADCSAVITDPFWADKFNSAAVGKFPKGFSFHDGVLQFKKGAKCPTLEVSNNSYIAAPACMEFFRSNGGLFSPIDQQNSMELQFARSQAVSNQQQLTWEDANTKIQECLLSNYVVDMKKLMALSNSEIEQLRQTVKLGIINKFFGKHNIRVENNRIHSFMGLLWNDQTRTFFIDPELKPVARRTYDRDKDNASAVDPSQKDTVPQFWTKWLKYLDSVDKKINRNDRRLRRGLTGETHLRLQLNIQGSTATPTTNVSTTDNDEDEDDDDESEE